MRYETVKNAMDSQEGRILYKILAMQFDRGYEMSPAVKAKMERLPCYLGSEHHLQGMVWAVLNGIQQICEIKEAKRANEYVKRTLSKRP